VKRASYIGPLARLDFAEISRWYEARTPGQGERFIETCLEQVGYIEEFPEMYPIDSHGRRRAPMRAFPYTIYYEVDDDLVVVLRVVYSRRGLETWEIREVAPSWMPRPEMQIAS
jgi:plasmid stabilization system protein ParE